LDNPFRTRMFPDVLHGYLMILTRVQSTTKDPRKNHVMYRWPVRGHLDWHYCQLLRFDRQLHSNIHNMYIFSEFND
jgi:hypothetical protein